ncbi:hypothetical protein [Pedobacter glucosidilyticus]|uniref:hypothetical protein n=1 Tax=Pedobacter glucosidilyticus TaxID=1122941 RepID=UPI0003FC46D2|nr:hypothetical protein [Pedobacter glucosidilyticus]
MREKLILLTIIGLLFSCNQNENKSVTDQEGVNSKQLNNKIISKTERQIIIEELQRLQSIIASNNKEKISDVFRFPINNETIGIYVDNKDFNEQLDKNGDKVTKNMFISFYNDISESIQTEQINQLFKKLDINKLLNKDNLEYTERIKTEPCHHFYGVKIENKLVTLTIGTNSNVDYKSKSTSEDEIQENDSSMCEHVMWWVFTFDGKKLLFKEITGAG